MNNLVRSPDQIGNVVRQARKKLGLSQAKFGELSGLRQETVSLIESGNPATRLDTILNVLSVLELEFRITSRTKGTDINIEDIF